jgi:hypothetical protein
MEVGCSELNSASCGSWMIGAGGRGFYGYQLGSGVRMRNWPEKRVGGRWCGRQWWEMVLLGGYCYGIEAMEELLESKCR